jgi:curli biogenesis system outer membrane secretion channel CsgG
MLTLAIVAAPAVRAADVRRPALAILDFDSATSGRMLAPPQLGAAAAQLLLDRLVASGAYRVFDGHWLQPGPRRADMMPPPSLRAYAASAGADYLVIGTITRFSEEQKRRGGGGIALPFPVLGALHRDKRDLAIDIVVRVVDARTGEIVTTASGLGVASRTNRSIGGFGLIAAAGGGGGFTNQAIGSRDAQLAEALERSIASAASALIAAAPRLYQAQAHEPR